MAELLTAAQMRAIEQAAIASGKVTGLELMERAGRGVVEAILEEWPERAKTSHRAVVLCGPGNNGGDGFVVARLLKERAWEVEVFLYGDPDRLPPDARANYERWRDIAETLPHGDLVDRLEYPGVDVGCPDIDLFVDAVFGTGLARAIPDDLARIAQQLNDRKGPKEGRARIVGVDIASGLCADAGEVIGEDRDAVFHCDLTISFHSCKLGHVLSRGAEICGKVVVKDIGLEARGRTPGDVAQLVDAVSVVGLEKNVQTHKYAHGHAMVLSGGPGKTGAARLAARAALRIGAGLVTLGVPPAAQFEVAAQITALMLTRISGAKALTDLLADTRLNALCLGPGLGVADHGRDLVVAALASRRPVVLDADALTVFRDAPSTLFDMLHEKAVLTPHGGEFARLFPDLAQRLATNSRIGPAYSKVDATRAAAARAGCTVLLKGAATVIATADGRCSVHSAQYERAAPWLATAGSGDVLAGFITGLLARGAAPIAACETAAWLHTQCALSFGPGLIAEDIPEELPSVLRELGI